MIRTKKVLEIFKKALYYFVISLIVVLCNFVSNERIWPHTQILAFLSTSFYFFIITSSFIYKTKQEWMVTFLLQKQYEDDQETDYVAFKQATLKGVLYSLPMLVSLIIPYFVHYILVTMPLYFFAFSYLIIFLIIRSRTIDSMKKYESKFNELRLKRS